jgi:hypothetical protein
VYSSGPLPNLFSRAADGRGVAERLNDAPGPATAARSFSPDGTRLVVERIDPMTGFDLYLLSLDIIPGHRPNGARAD